MNSTKIPFSVKTKPAQTFVQDEIVSRSPGYFSMSVSDQLPLLKRDSPHTEVSLEEASEMRMSPPESPKHLAADQSLLSTPNQVGLRAGSSHSTPSQCHLHTTIKLNEFTGNRLKLKINDAVQQDLIDIIGSKIRITDFEIETLIQQVALKYWSPISALADLALKLDKVLEEKQYENEKSLLTIRGQRNRALSQSSVIDNKHRILNPQSEVISILFNIMMILAKDEIEKSFKNMTSVDDPEGSYMSCHTLEKLTEFCFETAFKNLSKIMTEIPLIHSMDVKSQIPQLFASTLLAGASFGPIYEAVKLGCGIGGVSGFKASAASLVCGGFTGISTVVSLIGLIGYWLVTPAGACITRKKERDEEYKKIKEFLAILIATPTESKKVARNLFGVQTVAPAAVVMV